MVFSNIFFSLFLHIIFTSNPYLNAKFVPSCGYIIIKFILSAVINVAKHSLSFHQWPSINDYTPESVHTHVKCVAKLSCLDPRWCHTPRNMFGEIKERMFIGIIVMYHFILWCDSLRRVVNNTELCIKPKHWFGDCCVQ